MVAEMGRVMTQVISIRFAVPQFTPFTRWEAPTPKMDEEMTCVVLTGKWTIVAPKMMRAPVKSAETPLTGRIFMIFPPTVLMIFQPPTDVPSPMAMAHANCTQNGMSVVLASYPRLKPS